MEGERNSRLLKTGSTESNNSRRIRQRRRVGSLIREKGNRDRQLDADQRLPQEPLCFKTQATRLGPGNVDSLSISALHGSIFLRRQAERIGCQVGAQPHPNT